MLIVLQIYARKAHVRCAHAVSACRRLILRLGSVRSRLSGLCVSPAEASTFFCDHPVEISLDNIVQQNLNPSCILDDSGKSKECVTMLEVPPGSNGTIEIRVAVNDSAFTADVVAYSEIDFNSSTPVVEEETETDDSSAVSSTIIVVGGLGLIIMVLVLVIILRAMKSDQIDTSQQFSLEQEIEVDVVEQELGADLSPTGLLSRINQDK